MPEHVITLAAIRAHHPCESGWRTLISALGTSDPDTRLTIGDVAKANGGADAMWCLRCIDDPRVRVAAVMPAVKRAAANATDKRVHGCIAAIERWLAGDDSVDLRAAQAASWSAASTTTNMAARAVVRAAATEDVVSAAWAAAASASAAWVVAAERERQRDDLIKTFGMLAMEGRA